MVPKIRFTFSQPTRSARAVAHTPTRVGAPAARAECVRLPRARGGVRPTHIPPPSNPSRRTRAPPRARAGLPRRPSARVCPSLHAAPPTRSLPNLLDVSFAFAPVCLSPLPTLARRSSRPRPPFLRYFIPTCQQPAHRVRATPRPHACTPLPSFPSPETAPQYSGRAAAARNRAAGSTPAARTPPTHTGCLASPSARACPFLHAAPPQTLDLEHRRSPLLYVLYSTPTRPFSPPPLQHSTLPKPWT